MSTFSHLDLLSVGLVIAATLILGFIVFFNEQKSITNRTFLVFSILTAFWGTLNYVSYNILIPELALWFLRVSIFFAVWHSLFLFQLLYVFPEKSVQFPRSYKNILMPLVCISSLLNLTPFTFNRIAELSSKGEIIKIANGPGIAIFTFTILSLIIGGVFVFVKKMRRQVDSVKKQMKPTLWGIIFTFALILVFNFIFPAFLNNPHYITLGAVFIFPFILGTTYSIFKYGFLNVKVVSTEILTFILALVILFEVVTSTTLTTLLFRGSIFLLVVTTGILLIRSVRREVKQREELQSLTKRLGDANEQLQTLDKARAEFISIASHQLRTPPATVKWYLSAIVSGDYGTVSDGLMEPLKKTMQTNNHLISLIEDMLNVSRIERGKMEFLFEPTNVEELAQFAYEQLYPIAHDKKLNLTYEPPKIPLPQVMADKEKLRQVMNNLIDNALKYTKQGTVAVKIFHDETDIHFEVHDTGKGISTQDQTSIFQKYSRGKESIKQSAGLGLGLYVAKIIIEQHKGRIWAESKGEGQGAMFAFTLPIHNNLEATTLVDLAK